MDLFYPDTIRLSASAHILRAAVYSPTLTSAETFAALWKLRPEEPQQIQIRGNPVAIPRRQRALGRDYAFSGQVSRAEPVPDLLLPFMEWSRQNVDPLSNGLLVNWYEPASRDYIGAHRDSVKGLIEGSPIVTISLGAPRVFRLREFRGKARHDITVENGTVLVLPWETNRCWTHEALHRACDTGRRISVTLRTFAEPAGITKTPRRLWEDI